ncbi:hypothetical protein IAU59_006909 [Kwoniella sp. CBS 9459]
MPPSLLYHSLNPPLYPTFVSATAAATRELRDDGESSDSLLVVRFSGPVRISSLRIIPEGVDVGLGSGSASSRQLGMTHPATFDAEILLNISPSSPINALSRFVIHVTPADHALDFPINMPVGITSRMIMIRSPAQRLSLSIYGYSGGSLNTVEPDSEPASASARPRSTGAAASNGDVEAQQGSPQVYERDGSVERVNKEQQDWSWLWTWVHSTPSARETKSADLTRFEQLLDLLRPSIPHSIAQRAVDCINLLEDVSPQLMLIPRLLEDPALVRRLFTVFPESSLAQRIMNHAHTRRPYALHPNVVPYLTESHPLWPLTQASSSKDHQLAWKTLHLGLPALAIIGQHDGTEVTDEDLLRVEMGEEESNLARLLNLAEDATSERQKYGGTAESQERLGIVLDILDEPNRFMQDRVARSYLVRSIPRLSVIYNTRGGDRSLHFPTADAEEIIRNLVECSDMVMDGRSTCTAARQLAQPYIEALSVDDSLRRIFDASSPTQAGTAARVQYSNIEDAGTSEDQRRMNRLSTAMLTSTAPQIPDSSSGSSSLIAGTLSSIVHTATPAELLQLIAPALVEKLATAPVPPFGIPSTISTDISDQGTKAFAGKVYTSHEFRRDRGGPNEPSSSVGLGIGGPGMVGGMSIGMGGGGAPNLGMGGNMGRAPSTGGMGAGGTGSRPASRHVDAYAR